MFIAKYDQNENANDTFWLETSELILEFIYYIYLYKHVIKYKYIVKNSKQWINFSRENIKVCTVWF